jgi:3-methyladenine DNA glycosylase AlkD
VTTLAALRRALRDNASAADAAQLQRYFQTGPGGYAEGDAFLGVRVPAIRRIVRAHRAVSLSVACTLLQSRWHEERMLALLLMVQSYQRGDTTVRQAVFDAYLANLAHINNWDLVDSSAAYILGAHLSPNDVELLEQLAQSASHWERRIAMLATFHQIRCGEFRPALRVATLLRHDTHPLLHKAVGWMLREIGERDVGVERAFLDANWRTMPRTAVRYAIEHFTPEERRAYSL